MLLLFSAYAFYNVLYDNASLFFIIYLFWFDELIRNISLFIQVKMKVEDAHPLPAFTKKQAIDHIKGRFFFLFIYVVFIVLAFGLFYHIDNEDALVRNVRIFFFRDLPFNVCLMIAITREFFQLRHAQQTCNVPLQQFGAMNGQLITLHLSIIFGGFLWAFTSGRFKDFHLNLGLFNHYAIALPFFIIKLATDFYHIKQANKNQPLLQSLPKT